MADPIGDKLLQRTQFRIRVEGATVVLIVGHNSGIELDYDTATDLAVLLRAAGKKAKRNAGDTSVRLIGFADLTDGVLEEMKAQANRDRTAVFLRR